MRSLGLACLGALALAACGSASPVGELRFRPRSPVWRVNDRTPQEAEPAVHAYRVNVYKLDNAVIRRTTDAFELHPSKRVKDVNALDEVPDSTWFTNRIGVRDLTLDELRRGPTVDPSPFDHRPWTILSGKVGGKSLGFTFEDALHRKFLLKFDARAYPELETGTHIIVHRILWAVGYHVPQDFLGEVRRGDLVIGAKAREHGLDEAALERALRTVDVRADGSIRVLASMFVPGKPLGPYQRAGVRRDDYNDVIPHELRRSIRGQHALFAWLDHTDIKDDNTLDAFADGYVTHYLVDFGKALGVLGTTDAEATNGYESQYDFAELARNALTLGLRSRPWEGVRQPPLRGVGLFDAAHFDPGAWAPYQFYSPFFETDRFDSFWGAKLLVRFTPRELAAIFDEAHFSDPRAAAYLVQTLIARQRASGRYWFDRVAPLDAFSIESTGAQPRLCFTDLALHYGLRDGRTHYAIDTFDRDGKPTTFSADVEAGARGRTCATIRTADRDPERYTIVRLRVTRPGNAPPPVVVHLAKLRDGRLEVVGLRRR